MKTSHFSENFDLCHPQLGRSEQSNNNLSSHSDFASDSSTTKHDSIRSSATVNYSTPTYGSGSSDHQPTKYEKNANELLVKSQLRQQQQHQEQNKKRKRETGEFFKSLPLTQNSLHWKRILEGLRGVHSVNRFQTSSPHIHGSRCPFTGNRIMTRTLECIISLTVSLLVTFE